MEGIIIVTVVAAAVLIVVRFMIKSLAAKKDSSTCGSCQCQCKDSSGCVLLQNSEFFKEINKQSS